MRFSKLVRSIPGQFIMALAGVSLIIAPFGCETLSMFDDGNGRFGWFINDDTSKDVLLGVRAPSEASLFAYGTFTQDGNIETITAVVLRDPDGNESFIGLDENGRPVHLQIADGSYGHIEYDVATDLRVAGRIELYDAGEGTTESVPFDVDLDETLATLAAQLEELTGQGIEVLPDPNARTVSGASKGGNRNAETVVYPIFALPFVAMAYAISYVATAITAAIVNVVGLAIKATLMAVFAPIYLLTEVTGAVLFLPVMTLSLLSAFGTIPPMPIWILI